MKITLKNITKSFSGTTVIQPLNLVIDSGSFTTLLGPSGCGKTTLLRMLAGLETPDDGEIYFDERCVFSATEKINIPPEHRGLGFVFQDFALWPHMTVFENVAFGLRASGHTENLEQKVAQALAAVKLEDFAQRYPHQLSGGQQQRVAFARAIVIEPACILFDEPLSALDALLRESMRTELKELVSKLGFTAVFVTHDQLEAMSMSDKIAIFNNGVLQQYAAPEHIYQHPATSFTAYFIGKANWLDAHIMFRPEVLATSPIPNATSYNLQVVGSQYLGRYYELALQNEQYRWTIASPVPLPTGQNLTVYVPHDKLISF
ncbi:ABC transporter ATP-binding protein [Phascolarctobacterium sp.]|uniref:ABC transporter ATP-binding protein n=1 Tax=Phascolarctobacterium sp. TaxID=2049039 RepID=UPI00386A4322